MLGIQDSINRTKSTSVDTTPIKKEKAEEVIEESITEIPEEKEETTEEEFSSSYWRKRKNR